MSGTPPRLGDLPPIDDTLPDEAYSKGPAPLGEPLTDFSKGDLGDRPPHAPASPETALAYLRARVGMGEDPPGSNHNEITEEFFVAAGSPPELAGAEFAWCAATVSLALNEAWGDRQTWQVPGVRSTYLSGTADVYVLRQAFIEADRYDDEPRVGDVVIFGPDPQGQHTGIVEEVVGDGTVVTLEGNASDELRRIRRPLDVIIGFGHPPYETQEDPLMALSPAEQDQLLDLTRSTNAAVGRLEVAIRDSTNGLQAQVDILKAKIEELLAQ